MLDFLRARAEKRYALIISDPKPVGSVDNMWQSAAQVATIGIFVLLLGAALHFSRPLLLPVLTAMVIGATLSPIVKAGAKYGVSPWLTSFALTLMLVAAVALAVTLIAAPIAEWIGRAPEIGALIKQKLYVLERPIAAWRELQNAIWPLADNSSPPVDPPKLTQFAPAVVEFITPAVAQLVLFLTTLILFLAVQGDFRRYLVSVFSDREAKLRALRISSDVEHNLASYLAVVTVINLVLGVIVACGAWAFGFSSPLLFGILAAVLNYIPYVGPACMVLVLFGVGLVTFPTFGYALAPPACFVALTTAEGHIITPTILGRRLTLNPLVVFLALAFWTWLWGPMGAFLAVPLTIIGLVIFNHLFPDEEPKLPE
jgi:predicted PurR-regulated permease PerM